MIYNSVFEILDAEPELTGMQAGKVATASARSAYKELLKLYEIDSD